MSARRLTAEAPGAVAVVAVERSASDRLVELVGRELPPRGSIRLARLVSGSELIDEVLLVGRGASVEVHLHGGPAVVDRVLSELGRCAAESAPRSLAEQARELVATAPSEAGARILLDQAEGALEAELDRCRTSSLEEGRRRLEALVAAARGARPLLQAPRIVIAGPANAGKSTLFNVLLGTERALTSDRSGTTRDALSEPARLGVLGIELIDTAGEREADPSAVDPVEAAGQTLARRLRHSADLCLWLTVGGSSAGPVAEAPANDGLVTVQLVRDPDRPTVDVERGRIASLEDPEGTRRVVGERVAARLAFDDWIPGRPVPFTDELVVALEALVEVGCREARDRAIGSIAGRQGTAPRGPSISESLP